MKRREKITQRRGGRGDSQRRARVHTEGTEKEHRGHGEERPAWEGGHYENEKRIGELGHLKVAATLAEEPA